MTRAKQEPESKASAGKVVETNPFYHYGEFNEMVNKIIEYWINNKLFK